MQFEKEFFCFNKNSYKEDNGDYPRLPSFSQEFPGEGRKFGRNGLLSLRNKLSSL